MDGDIARVAIAAIIGGTIMISMAAMAVAQIVTARRKRGLPDAAVDRIDERLSRIEQAIDAMATEVERVSENQRFTSRLLAEGRQAGHEAVPGSKM